MRLADLVAAYEDEHYPIEPAGDAEMLQHLMEAKRVSQTDVHRATGLPKSTISEVLAGKKRFSRQMIRKLAQYFDVDVSCWRQTCSAPRGQQSSARSLHVPNSPSKTRIVRSENFTTRFAPSGITTHRQRLQIRHRLTAQRVEHRTSCGKDVRYPALVAVFFQRLASFAAADIDFDAGIFHPLELRDETPRSLFEAWIFEHAEYAVVEGHWRL